MRYSPKEPKDIVRIAVAGSVDDGKSTLLGRLYYESGALFCDELATIEKASALHGFSGIDFSFVTDGLAAERTQGITIDVAYRYFDLGDRRYILADVPGHEEYTANMVTGVSNADAVLLIVDVTKGLTVQAKRHLALARYFAGRSIMVAINKIDLVGFSEEAFRAREADVRAYALKCGVSDLVCIPTSGLLGDMVVHALDRMPWYKGKTVAKLIEDVPQKKLPASGAWCMPIQCMVKTHHGERWYAGEVAGGKINAGDEIKILPSLMEARIASMVVYGRVAKEAQSGEPIAVLFDREVDCTRGSTLIGAGAKAEATDTISVVLFITGKSGLTKDKPYLFTYVSLQVRVSLEQVTARFSFDEGTMGAANALSERDLGEVVLRAHEHIFVLPSAKESHLRDVMIIDPYTHETVAVGKIL